MRDLEGVTQQMIDEERLTSLQAQDYRSELFFVANLFNSLGAHPKRRR